MAAKRFPTKSKDEAIAAMAKQVENKSPGTNAATVSLLQCLPPNRYVLRLFQKFSKIVN